MWSRISHTVCDEKFCFVSMTTARGNRGYQKGTVRNSCTQSRRTSVFPCKTITTHRIFAGAIYISFWIFIATSIGRNDHNFRIKIRKMRFFCIPLNPNFRTPNWYPNFKFVLLLNQATHSGPSARFILAHNYSSKRTHILMSKLLRSAGWTKQNACNSRTPKVTYGTFSKTARAVTN